MKTDLAVEEELRATRKRLFWRLYSFPWIIVIAILLAVCLFSMQVTRKTIDSSAEILLAMAENDKIQVEEGIKSAKDIKLDWEKEEQERRDLIDLGILKGMRIVRQEAVREGYGNWLVDKETMEIKFTWQTLEMISSNAFSSLFSNRVILEGIKEVNPLIGEDSNINQLDWMFSEREIVILPDQELSLGKVGKVAEIDQRDWILEDVQSEVRDIKGILKAMAKQESAIASRMVPNDLRTPSDIPDIPVEVPTYRDRSVGFTYEDLEFAREIGIDLEQDVIGSVRVKISEIFARNGGRVSVADLQKEVQETIHKRFDGFETYKKVR